MNESNFSLFANKKEQNNSESHAAKRCCLKTASRALASPPKRCSISNHGNPYLQNYPAICVYLKDFEAHHPLNGLYSLPLIGGFILGGEGSDLKIQRFVDFAKRTSAAEDKASQFGTRDSAG